MSEKFLSFRLFSGLLLATISLCVCSKPLLSRNHQRFATDLEGRPFDFSRAARGKIVVLIFVRTDFPISNRYAPTIQQLGAEHRNDETFFLVYPGQGETPDALRKIHLEFGLPVTLVVDLGHVVVKQ